MMHICNPGFSGGGDRADHVSRTAQAEVIETPTSTNMSVMVVHN
jgi:hypothetical protein